MKLTHARDNRLTRLSVCVCLECGILFHELAQSYHELILTRLCLGLYCDLDNGVGELHGFKEHRMIHIAERVARGRILYAYKCDYIACISFVELLTHVGVHEYGLAYTLARSLCGIQNVAVAAYLAAVDSAECELADILVDDNLKCQSCKRCILVCGQFYLFACLSRCSHCIGYIER